MSYLFAGVGASTDPNTLFNQLAAQGEKVVVDTIDQGLKDIAKGAKTQASAATDALIVRVLGEGALARKAKLSTREKKALLAAAKKDAQAAAKEKAKAASKASVREGLDTAAAGGGGVIEVDNPEGVTPVSPKKTGGEGVSGGMVLGGLALLGGLGLVLSRRKGS